MQALQPDAELSLAGFSLGANFWLRVGARAPRGRHPHQAIVAVCPVLDPATTLAALEHGPAIYRQYFLFKWRRSLRAKQASWPDIYDFGDTARRSVIDGDDRAHGAALHGLSRSRDLPAGLCDHGRCARQSLGADRLITSADDPMILTHDLERLARPEALRVTLTPRGGHCGYMDALGGPSWIERHIVATLDRD